MCSPSRATLFTGRFPAAARRRAHPHRGRPAAPIRATRPRWWRRWPTSCAAARRPRGGCCGQFAARRCLRLGPKSGGEPELPSRDGEPRHAAARGRLHGRLQGQVAPDPPGRRRGLAARRLDASATPSGSSATTGSPSGRRPTRARTRRRRTSAAATPARGRAGTRSTPARWSGGSAAPSCRSRSASSSRWSTPTTCSATRPPTCRGGYAAERVPRPRRRAAADGRRGPGDQARGAVADADGDGRLHRARCATAGRSSTT